MEKYDVVEIDTAVAHILHTIRQQAQDILGNQFISMIAHGSLALGDFNPDRSDIDFVVVTAVPLTPTQQQQIATMHTQLRATGQKWANKLEGSYIPRAALRHYDPADANYPALRIDGTFAIDTHGPDWIIQRHVLREHGIILAGPHPRTLIDPVSPAALRQATSATLRDWWAPMLTNPESFIRNREYEVYATLTMCRCLYTLAHSAIVGKATAAAWAVANQPSKWTDLINSAANWPRGPQDRQLAQTLAFIRYTLAKSSPS